MHIARKGSILTVLAAGVLSSGCVSKQQYGTLEMAYGEQRRNTESLKATVDRLSRENAGQRLQMRAKQELLDKQSAELDLAKSSIAQPDSRARGLMHANHEMERIAKASDGAMNWDPTKNMLSLDAQVFFAAGAAEVKPEAKAVLSRVAKALAGTKETILCVGHTDSDPIVKTKDKWPLGNPQLSGARALAVLVFLQADGKLAAGRLSFEGRGSNEPVASNETPDGKRKNRRVEIYLKA